MRAYLLLVDLLSFVVTVACSASAPEPTRPPVKTGPSPERAVARGQEFLQAVMRDDVSSGERLLSTPISNLAPMFERQARALSPCSTSAMAYSLNSRPGALRARVTVTFTPPCGSYDVFTSRSAVGDPAGSSDTRLAGCTIDLDARDDEWRVAPPGLTCTP